jgi:Solute carrier family 12
LKKSKAWKCEREGTPFSEALCCPALEKIAIMEIRTRKSSICTNVAGFQQLAADDTGVGRQSGDKDGHGHVCPLVRRDPGHGNLARVLVGDLRQIAKLRETAVNQLKEFLAENHFEALSSVVITSSLDEGLTALIQGQSIGPLRPNIVMMGWPADPDWIDSFVHHLNAVRLLEMSLVVVRDKGLPDEGDSRRIDVWWRGRQNGSLMVLLAHLLTLNWGWNEAEIRLLRLIDDEAGRAPSTEALQDLLLMARVKADVQVLVSSSPFSEVLQRHSADASVVMLGFNVPEEGSAREFQDYFEKMMGNLPTTLLVSSSGEADLFV